MNELIRDFIIAILFIGGLIGFISGEFILSSALFAVTAIASYIRVTNKTSNNIQLS